MPQPPALPGNFVSSTTPTTPTPALHDDGNGSLQVPSGPGTSDGRRAPTKSVCAARPRGRQSPGDRDRHGLGVRPNRARVRLNTLTDTATCRQPAPATGVTL